MDEKDRVRERLRIVRRNHVSVLPESVRSLLFLRPPMPIAERLSPGTTVGLYHALPAEAPTLSYAKWLHENGFSLALPWFADRASPMRYREWHDPYDADELEPAPFGMRQPSSSAREVDPDTVVVPVVGFTARGDRLGQGGGHFDRWLAAHPGVLAIGLAWDCQLVEKLPLERHDQPLDAVVTPTRMFEKEL